MRMDESQSLEWYHRYQCIYGPILFCFVYWSIQLQDLSQLLDARSFLVNFRGTNVKEIVLSLLLKSVHVFWFLILPTIIHGPTNFTNLLKGWAAASAFGGFMLSMLFIVSHNLDTVKHVPPPKKGDGDWAKYQIETSSSWGGDKGSFMTGGLNLQVEHHLFPCLPHNKYTDVQRIVKEECKKEGIKYVGYNTITANFWDHLVFLKNMGKPKQA